MERWVTKTICGCIMLVVMLMCFLLPIKLTVFFRRRGDNGQYYLDLLSCFAGGVFLAAYLIFMAPAVRELILVNLMVPYQIDYPLPDMLIGVGFFILLLLNRVVISMSKISRKRNSKEDFIIHAMHNGASVVGDKSSEFKHLNQSQNGCTDRNHDGRLASPGSETHCHHMDGEIVVEMGAGEDLVFQPESNSPYPLARRSSIADVAHQDSMVRSIVMMLALSLDSVLEGVTTGLKTTNVEVWAIFIGNMVHETVIAFCLGLQLIRVHDNLKPVMIAAVAYSLMNPLGLAVATIIFESVEASPTIDLFNGLFQALTSGCFIYVTFCEILEGQITHRTSYAKIFCMFSGFFVLAAFAAVPGSSSYALELLSSNCTEHSSSNVIPVATTVIPADVVR